MSSPKDLPTPGGGLRSAEAIAQARAAEVQEATRNHSLLKEIVESDEAREQVEVRQCQRLGETLREPYRALVGALQSWKFGYKVLSRFRIAEVDALLGEPIVNGHWMAVEKGLDLTEEIRVAPLYPAEVKEKAKALAAALEPCKPQRERYVEAHAKSARDQRLLKKFERQLALAKAAQWFVGVLTLAAWVILIVLSAGPTLVGAGGPPVSPARTWLGWVALVIAITGTPLVGWLLWRWWRKRGGEEAQEESR